MTLDQRADEDDGSQTLYPGILVADSELGTRIIAVSFDTRGLFGNFQIFPFRLELSVAKIPCTSGTVCTVFTIQVRLSDVSITTVSDKCTGSYSAIVHGTVFWYANLPSPLGDFLSSSIVMVITHSVSVSWLVYLYLTCGNCSPGASQASRRVNNNITRDRWQKSAVLGAFKER